jgi:hypothetical protein
MPGTISWSITWDQNSISAKWEVGATMTSPEGVRLILKGWLSKSSVIFCEASLFGFSFSSKCRVVEVKDDAAVLDSVDGAARVIVDLGDPESRILYAEPRAYSDSNPDVYASLSESQSTASTLSIAFPLRVKLSAIGDVPTSAEKVFLMELPE